MFVLCKEDNLIMNQYNLPDCNALNFENTQSLVKLYWDASRQMEFPQVPEH